MRITGLASGIDTESMVKELMAAHRKPLEKIIQQKELANWKIDAYREVNTKLLEFRKSMEELRLERPFNSIVASSTNDSKVVATSTGAKPTQSSYEISNITLAQSERAASVKFFTNGFDTSKTLTELGISPAASGNVEITINGQAIAIDPSKSLSTALTDISSQSGVNVTYSTTDKSFTFTDKITGAASKVSIAENGSDFLSTLGMSAGEVSATSDFTNSNTVSSVKGRNKTQASATINGLVYKSDTNSISFDGLQFDLKGSLISTEAPINVSVKQDDTGIYDKIKTFVDKYNEVIEELNEKLSERKSRNYQPLTNEQKEAMSDKEIELWEEKAKVGLLGRDPILNNVLTSMRNAMSSPVQGADAGAVSPIDTLEEIGINLSDNWRDKGKLIIDETKLKAMISTDLSKVAEIFNKSTSTLPANDTSKTTESTLKFSQSGVADRIYERLEATMRDLSSQALKGSQSVIGKQMSSLDTRISQFEDRLTRTEDRYWRQFTAMEKAIQQSNSQSTWLMQQFNY